MSYNSPNPDNYTLGKGVLYFDKFDANSNLTGERDLGNAPELMFNMTVDMLDHFSSRSGLSAKDKQVVKQITPTFSFTLDEINADNMSMLFYGEAEDVAQVASDYNTFVLPAVLAKNLYYSLGKRQVGIYKMSVAYEAGKTAADLPDASQISNTSGLTPTNYWEVITAVGNTVYVKGKTGTGLTASGDVYVGTTKIATYSAAPAFAKEILIKEGATWFVPGADFTVDSVLGRIKIGAASTLAGAGTAHFAVNADSYKKIKLLSNNSLEGKIRFVSDNPEGSQYSFEAWKCSLKPDGDTAFIGEDWSTVKFVCEILNDAVNHPDNPYMEVIVV